MRSHWLTTPGVAVSTTGDLLVLRPERPARSYHHMIMSSARGPVRAAQQTRRQAAETPLLIPACITGTSDSDQSRRAGAGGIMIGLAASGACRRRRRRRCSYQRPGDAVDGLPAGVRRRGCPRLGRPAAIRSIPSCCCCLLPHCCCCCAAAACARGAGWLARRLAAPPRPEYHKNLARFWHSLKHGTCLHSCRQAVIGHRPR